MLKCTPRFEKRSSTILYQLISSVRHLETSYYVQNITDSSLVWVFQKRLLFTAKPKCNPVFRAAEKFAAHSQKLQKTIEVHSWEWEFALDFAGDLVDAFNLTPAASLKHAILEALTEETLQNVPC